MAGIALDARHKAVNIIPRPLDDLQEREVMIEQDARDSVALVVFDTGISQFQ
jgi:hypothetical protein